MTFLKKKSKWMVYLVALLLFALIMPVSLAQVKAEEGNEDDNEEADANEETDEEADQAEDKTTNKVKDISSGSITVPKGLVAHWTFDGNYTESESGLKTELGAKNLAYTDGIHGKAAVFNGKDNFLTVANDPILNLGNSMKDNNDNFTISAWINLGNSKYGIKYLLDKGSETGWERNNDCYYTNPYRISFDTCEPIVALSNRFEENATGYITEGESTTRDKSVEGEEWFLLTVTYDGTRVKIYHNNELLIQSNYSHGITFNEDDLFIGVDGRLETYFKGAMDDLRIYTTTLSYDEVSDLYQQGVKANKELLEPSKRLVAYYGFDGELLDASVFKNDAKPVAKKGAITYVIGKNGKAVVLSKGNYIQVPAARQLNLETEFTVSCWLKLNTDGDYPILYRQNPSYSDEAENDWTYRLNASGWGKGDNTEITMDSRIYNPDSWVAGEGQNLHTLLSYSENKLKATDWIHYTCTYKDGQMISYINGKQFLKSEKSDFLDIANASGDLLIGYDGTTFLAGTIDELKIYNSCLDPDEVEKEAKRVDSISLSKEDKKVLSAFAKGKAYSIKTILLTDVDKKKNAKIKSSDKNVKMTSSDIKVFTVTNDGKITAVRAGKAKLTITYGAHSVTYVVVIK